MKGIILAISRPNKELLDQLEELAGQYHLKIYHWKVELEDAGLTEVVPSIIAQTCMTSMSKGRDFEVAEAM